MAEPFITVWVLVFYLGTFQSGGPAVVDNIATQAQCEKLRDQIRAERRGGMFVCVPVKKLRI